MSLISSQPNTSTMDVYGPLSTHEKRSLTCQHNDHNLNYPCECSSASHRACHKSRLRRIILPIALSLLSIGAFLIISHCSEIGDLLEALGLNHGHVSGVLDKRQTTTGSSFTSKKCRATTSSLIVLSDTHFSVPNYYFRRPCPRPASRRNAQFLVLQRLARSLNTLQSAYCLMFIT